MTPTTRSLFSAIFGRRCPSTAMRLNTSTRFIAKPSLSYSTQPQQQPLEEDNSTETNYNHIYRNASSLHLPDSAKKILSQPIIPSTLSPNPKTGFIYMSESKYYEILDDAVGNSGWHLEPISPYTIHESTISRSYALYIHDTFVSEARGETELPKDVDASSIPDEALEEIDSKCAYTALVRCGKDLGIASELWDGKFSKKFLKEQCVRVWEPRAKSFMWKLKN